MRTRVLYLLIIFLRIRCSIIHCSTSNCILITYLLTYTHTYMFVYEMFCIGSIEIMNRNA